MVESQADSDQSEEWFGAVSDGAAIAILAGGASQRMGADKAQLLVAGVPQLERLVQIAQGMGEVVIAGRTRPLDWPPHRTAAFVSDAVSGAGPLAGVVAALGWAKERGFAHLTLLACDYPALDNVALRWLHGLSMAADGAVATAEGAVQPLLARYAVALLPRAEDLLALRRGPRALVDAAAIRRHEIPPSLRRACTDADTPDAWAQLTEPGPRPDPR
jgi:molybdopterin-guanine dinucleotide biosynthesis protein A